jgi:hypothetical protein
MDRCVTWHHGDVLDVWYSIRRVFLFYIGATLESPISGWR